jgi:hypothetical protein
MHYDISVRGIKKVNVVWKRGGKKLQDHMKKILEQSKLKEDDYAKDLDEKGNLSCKFYLIILKFLYVIVYMKQNSG